VHVIDHAILKRLYDRPSWAKSLVNVKPRVEMLVKAGYVERIAPPDALPRNKNMLKITLAGCQLLEGEKR
jgi:hypothetical protein